MSKKTDHKNPTLAEVQRGMDEHRAQKRSGKPPISDAKRAANIANASKSTGPRTESGKARSSQNATKHGLLSESINAVSANAAAITPESLAATVAQFTRDLAPTNDFQLTLVARLAHLHLRLQRSAQMEEALLTKAFDKAEDHSLDHPDYYPEPTAPNHTAHLLARTYDHVSKELNLLSFYEARLSRDFHRTLRQLKEAQNGTADANPRVHAPQHTPHAQEHAPHPQPHAPHAPAAPPPEASAPNPTKRTQPDPQPADSTTPAIAPAAPPTTATEHQSLPPGQLA